MKHQIHHKNALQEQTRVVQQWKPVNDNLVSVNFQDKFKGIKIIMMLFVICFRKYILHKT